MPYILASAQNIDASVSTLTLVLISMGIVLAAAIAAIVPLVIAASRGHRRPESLVAVTILWACLTAASLIYMTMTQMKWASERDLRIKTGYYDPQQATSDAPPLPAGQWTALGIGYTALVGWAFARRARS
jgi:hypothetical protein